MLVLMLSSWPQVMRERRLNFVWTTLEEELKNFYLSIQHQHLFHQKHCHCRTTLSLFLVFMLAVKEKLLSRSTSPKMNGLENLFWLQIKIMLITMLWLLQTLDLCTMDKWCLQQMHSIYQWTAWSIWKWTSSGSMIYTIDGGMIWTSLLIIASTKSLLVVKLGMERFVINSQKTMLDQTLDTRWSNCLMDLFKKD